MTFPSQKQIDVIATQILLDAKQALATLKAWNNSITDGTAKVRLFKELIKSTATQMNGDFKAATSAVTKFSSALGTNPALVRQVGKELQNAGNAGKSAFDKVFTSVNTARIALGAITSMILFQVIQAFTELARGSIEQFTQLEDSLWRIVVAEKELSKQGQEISVAGLKKGIEDIKKLLPIFSEQDISGLVGKVAISTKELGYTEDQIISLSKAIAVLNVVSTENEDLNATAGKVITALLSGTTKGVSGLGVQLNDTVIKEKAVQLGFIKITDSIDDLTKKQKDFTKLSIVLDTANGSLGVMDEYMKTNAAKLKENAAGWDDLKTAIGGFTSSVIPALSGVFELLAGGVNAFKALVVIFDTLRLLVADVFNSFSTGKNAIDGIQKAVAALSDLPKIFDAIAKKEVPQLFAKMPANAPDWFKNIFGKYLQDVETATNETAKFKDELADDEEVLKALAAIEEGIQDIILDAQQAQADLDVKLKQKQEDLDKEYVRKREDAARDHAQKLTDIDLDARRKAEDAKAKMREDEKKAEQDLLQKLKELRDKFLLDLEDALHARDARQVLRLIKEYKMEKQHLLERKKLDDEQRKQSLADELAAIELDRRRRIENENIEYKRKLEDLATSKAREQEELQLWYKREQEDIQRNIEEKLQKLLAGYIAEGKIHESEQAKIYAILQKYFGKDMALVDSLAQFMATRFAQIQGLAGMTPAAAGSLNAQLGLPDKANPFAGGFVSPDLGNPPIQTTGFAGGFASGGSFIANRPTLAMFGEKGAEKVSAVPLNHSKSNGGSFGDISGGGINGQIFVAVDLSPDLEGRIVTRSLDGVADVIGRVNNRKVN